ncbi:hypothetical protein K443DRAFT_8161 [Laccaria amethystina LaAM-08-1]|uniref:Uncharacterized protein n=1 Tax=Laccaria amethystina LaAM-08-1 TaxID=1095629 RepID=A0A0C9XUX5_9AGAR|nr:hypothetical protein K443DRAFT_8161 [Laccaria amethystina LaAM-08-1]
MSHSGQVAVKMLVEDGVRLVSVVEDVVEEEVEEEVVGLIDEKEEEIRGNEVWGQPNDPSKVQLNKSGADVLAVEDDKTTMKLVNALESFGDSVWNFTSTGVKQQRKRDTTAQQQPTATPPMVYDRSSKEVNGPAPRGRKNGKN